MSRIIAVQPAALVPNVSHIDYDVEERTWTGFSDSPG